jgi:hypothetical protein
MSAFHCLRVNRQIVASALSRHRDSSQRKQAGTHIPVSEASLTPTHFPKFSVDRHSNVHYHRELLRISILCRTVPLHPKAITVP